MVQNINLGSVQAPYWEQTITLKPNERRKIEYVTDNFQLKEASVPNVLRVNFGGSMIDTRFSAGMGYKMTEPVQFVELWNDNNIDLTVDFVLGVGEIRDNRLTVSGQVDTLTEKKGYSKVGFFRDVGTIEHKRGFAAGSLIAVMCAKGPVNFSVKFTGENNTNLIILDVGQSFELTFAKSGEFSISPVTQGQEFKCNVLVARY